MAREPPLQSCCAGTPTSTCAPSYARRRPEETVLHAVVRGELETFLARARERDRPVPRFVEREFRAYLACGLLEHGFVRVRCDACGCDRLVAFSCKGRAFCPSCGGRRMADTAGHLVDRVLPEVPVRQWVLSLPFALRHRLAYDAQMTSTVLSLFVRTVFASLRRRARRQWGIGRGQCGAVTFVQRFGDALNANVHFHSLVLDGVYEPKSGQWPRFFPLPAPDDAEVVGAAGQVARKLCRLLEREGLGAEADVADADPLAAEEPFLATLTAASVSGRTATGPRAGRRTLRLGDRIDAEDLPKLEGERCASVNGVSLHANVAVPARDRLRLERLCRYVSRPPVATGRLSRQSDGRLLYRLKHRWRDGTTHVVFEPHELMERLAALVPRPRAHLVRYHGILGPCASDRDRVVPAEPAPRVRGTGVCCPEPPVRASDRAAVPAASAPASVAAGPAEIEAAGRSSPPSHAAAAGPSLAGACDDDDFDAAGHRARRLSWAQLLQRVFAVDVLVCPKCSGRMRILATIHPPEATRAILTCLNLAVRGPPVTPAQRVEDNALSQVQPESDFFA